MARVAVLGLGNVGSVFAAYLAESGKHIVTACVRRDLPDEIRIATDRADVSYKPICVRQSQEALPVDWVLLATKTHDSSGAAPWLHQLCRNHTRLLILQNGVDQENRIRPLCPSPCLIPTVVYTNAKRLAPERIRHLRPGYDLAVPDDERGRSVEELFSGSRIVVRREPDFITASWRKFLINVAANPLTAIAGEGIGCLRKPEMHALAVELLREAATVGRACGASLPANVEDDVLGWIAQFPPETGTSMLEDRMAKRTLEHDAITGFVVRRGTALGIPVPLNQAIWRVLRGLSELAQ